MDVCDLRVLPFERLAVECARAAQQFPEYEQDALGDQLRRACYSIPLNIAEGSSRKGSRDYRKFLDTAWGSLAEVQTAIAIARAAEVIPSELHPAAMSDHCIQLRCKRIHLLTTVEANISSSRIRELASQNNPLKGLVPEAVEEYIQKLSLYQNEDQVE